LAKTFNRLNPARVKRAKPGLHADGGGLYLQVTLGADGQLNKSWFFRFARDGRERRMGLGPQQPSRGLPAVSLAQARIAAEQARRLLQLRIDPIRRRDAEQAREKAEAEARTRGVVTFRRAFDTYFATKHQSLSNAKHKAQWQSTMQTYVFPIIGDKPVADVTASDIVAVLTPIWFEKPETAKRVLQRVEAVFKSAILHGHRKVASPCVGVREELGTRHHKVTNHRALPYVQFPDFLVRLRTGPSWPATRLAFEWLILTATRSGETRLARWAEIDEQAALWTISAERMKAKRPHSVPLSPRCLEILQALRPVYPHGPDDLMFPSMKAGAPLSDMTLTKVLRDMGLAKQATVHGMRSAFKVWCAEVARVRDEVSEAALAHVIPEKVRAAYLRTDFLEERKLLMAAWAKFCSERVLSDRVVPLRPSA